MAFFHRKTAVHVGISVSRSDADLREELYTGTETMFRPGHSGNLILVSRIPS